MIFSWAQIWRSTVFGREIGVPDRDIFSRQILFKFNVKNCFFTSALITENVLLVSVWLTGGK